MDKQINTTLCTEFLGVTLDSTLSWQGQITKLIAKLRFACVAIRALKLFSNIEDLRIVYFAYVHSIITYGLPFWGNAVNSKNVLTQKRTIRVIMNVNHQISCGRLFKHFASLLLLVAKNASRFVMSNEIYTINTRLNINLHLLSVNLSKYIKGAYCMGVEIFNHLL
jgi:hypothetical protein